MGKGTDKNQMQSLGSNLDSTINTMPDADQDTAAEECADIFHADRNNAANRTEVDIAAGVVIQTTFQAHALGLVSEEEKQDDKAKEKMRIMHAPAMMMDM
eukprot:scaffold93529_cov62-Attheya_sp.AAC.2